MERTTLVLGASTNPSRYANMAIHSLRRHGHAVIAFGPRPGIVADVPIVQEWPKDGVDTVTLYIGADRQSEYYAPLLALRPRRVIFNPGTENGVLEHLLSNAGIHCEEACTLVMLGSGTY